jgi:hypothetical protein
MYKLIIHKTAHIQSDLILAPYRVKGIPYQQNSPPKPIDIASAQQQQHNIHLN